MEDGSFTNLVHRPESYYAVQSAQYRTISGLCSLSFAIILSSKLFNSEKDVFMANAVQILGILLFIFSLIFGIKTNNDFNSYLNELSESKDLPPFYQRRIPEWREWVYYFYVYFGFITLIVLFFIIHKIIILVKVKK